MLTHSFEDRFDLQHLVAMQGDQIVQAFLQIARRLPALDVLTEHFRRSCLLAIEVSGAECADDRQDAAHERRWGEQAPEIVSPPH